MIAGIFFSALGLVFGSFLNAWEYRIETKNSLKGRSFCPKCKKQLFWHDNIPLLSWLILRGKCRHCHESISLQYPAVELITAIVFLLLWHSSSSGVAISSYLKEAFFSQSLTSHLSPLTLIHFLLLASYFLLLILVGLHDAKTKYVLTKYVYVALILGFVYTVMGFRGGLDPVGFLDYIYPYLLTALIPAGFLWLMSKLSKGKAMGEGDADIALAIGIILGWPKVLVGYYLAFISAAIYGAVLLLLKKGRLKSEVPFGPFLIVGAFFGLLFGQQIIDWYVRIFLGY